jgi:ketosteroid isomerase-like protein
MSEENVEIVRRLVEAWNEHDEALAASYLADDIEWAPAGPAAVDRVVYRGPEEFARGFAAVWETWDQFHFEEADVRDLDDSALWLGRVRMRGRASHIELDQEFANRFDLRDGLITRVHAFLTWRDALKAAGLSEYGTTAREIGPHGCPLSQAIGCVGSRQDYPRAKVGRNRPLPEERDGRQRVSRHRGRWRQRGFVGAGDQERR